MHTNYMNQLRALDARPCLLDHRHLACLFLVCWSHGLISKRFIIKTSSAWIFHPCLQPPATRLVILLALVFRLARARQMISPSGLNFKVSTSGICVMYSPNNEVISYSFCKHLPSPSWWLGSHACHMHGILPSLSQPLVHGYTPKSRQGSQSWISPNKASLIE